MAIDKTRWGRKRISSHGYALIKYVGHPRAFSNGYVYEHILVAESALGHPLPNGAQVHHVNGDGTNNDPSNLVICESNSYHKLLHFRQRAYESSGNVNHVKCKFCNKWGEINVNGMRIQKSRRGERFTAYHKLCHSVYENKRLRRAALP